MPRSNPLKHSRTSEIAMWFQGEFRLVSDPEELERLKQRHDSPLPLIKRLANLRSAVFQ